VIAGPEIRETSAADWPALEALYAAAFPDEPLLELLRALLAMPGETLSLGAVSGGRLVGNGAFTWGHVAPGEVPAALLGPLAVAPDNQRRGIGGEIVRAGLARLAEAGCHGVFVLGDPAYYARFGFRGGARIAPPCPIAEEWAGAWQALSLPPHRLPETGHLLLPEVWRDPALWAP